MNRIYDQEKLVNNSFFARGGGGGGDTSKFNTERLRSEVQPLILLYAILAEKVPLFYTFY